MFARVPKQPLRAPGTEGRHPSESIRGTKAKAETTSQSGVQRPRARAQLAGQTRSIASLEISESRQSNSGHRSRHPQGCSSRQRPRLLYSSRAPCCVHACRRTPPEFRSSSRLPQWALLDSNQQPLLCKSSALAVELSARAAATIRDGARPRIALPWQTRSMPSRSWQSR